MFQLPTTQYVKSGGAHVAFQVVGDGPLDLVVFGALASHVEMIWEDPTAALFHRRLAGFSRPVIYDKLGVGMSDPIPGGDSSLEQKLDDCRAVLDAVDCMEAVFSGHTGDGVMAVFDRPAQGFRCAQAVAADVAPLGLELRIGLHIGEVEFRGDDVAGIAVHIAARVAAMAGGGEVMVSHSIPPLVVGSGL